jgi:hypothetical protein
VSDARPLDASAFVAGFQGPRGRPRYSRQDAGLLCKEEDLLARE